MKRVLSVLAVTLALTMSACNAQQTAQSISNVLAGILNIAQAETPTIPAADQAQFTSWVTLGQTLQGQLNTCIAASGSTKAKLNTCLTTFASGLLAPAEMTQLRIMSVHSQSRVQLYATAAIIAVNGILTQFGATAVPAPTVTTVTAQFDIDELQHSLAAAGYTLAACAGNRCLFHYTGAGQ